MTGSELATISSGAVRSQGTEISSAASSIPWMLRIEEHSAWEMLAQLRVVLRAGVPLDRFKVQDLLALKEGQVLKTAASSTEDVSVTIGKMQLAWSEFEVVEQRMALRLTRLA